MFSEGFNQDVCLAGHTAQKNICLQHMPIKILLLLFVWANIMSLPAKKMSEAESQMLLGFSYYLPHL